MSFWTHIKYFTPDEFKCSHCGKEKMEKEFMVRLDMLRRRVGKPMKVNSGYRCPDHPIEKAKSSPGPHTTGRAADIAIYGGDAAEALYLRKLIGFTGTGVKQHGPVSGRFLHIDDLPSADGRPRPWLWGYA